MILPHVQTKFNISGPLVYIYCSQKIIKVCPLFGSDITLPLDFQNLCVVKIQ